MRTTAPNILGPGSQEPGALTHLNGARGPGGLARLDGIRLMRPDRGEPLEFFGVPSLVRSNPLGLRKSVWNCPLQETLGNPFEIALPYAYSQAGTLGRWKACGHLRFRI